MSKVINDSDAVAPAPTAPVEEIMAWGRGWAVSRGVPAPDQVPGGFRAEVGRPGHRVRYVLHTWARDAIGALGRQVAAPGTWIKVGGRAADLRDALPATWRMGSAGHLMTTRFAGPPESPHRRTGPGPRRTATSWW